MEDFVVSAPGKIILHGEHAVVYGKVAIAAALNLRTFLRAKKTNDGKVTANLPNIGIKISWSTTELQSKLSLPLCDPYNAKPVSPEMFDKLKEIGGMDPDSKQTTDLAVISFLYLFTSLAVTSSTVPSVEVIVSSGLPVSAGLGSSAGYSCCLAASLLQLNGLITPKVNGEQVWSEADKTLINSWSFISEKIIHGNPSGIDNSISTFGGAIRFQSGKITPLEKMPNLRILLVNTKVPRSTKELVEGVKNRYNKYPDIMKPILESTESITKTCELFLSRVCENPTSDNYKVLEELIDINQHLLESMGVSHPALGNIIRITNLYGLHTKLTGAGGGGCTFTLIKPDTPEEKITDVKTELERLGFQCWETSVGGSGVTNHSLDYNQLPSELL